MGIAVDKERSTLANLETLEGIAFPLTPHVVSPSASANYNNVGGIGASSDLQIYQSTQGETLTIDFPYYRVGLANSGGMSVAQVSEIMEKHRVFVRALLVPGTRPDGLSRGAPPLCLLTIPYLLEWTCRVRAFAHDISRAEDGMLLNMTLKITFQEEWEEPLSAEDVVARGYQRG
jgi:hypothetical protein